MKNLADMIEQLILKKLADEEKDIILKRNELADELSCAPSQISYVLSTRFTFQKGFIVESRRGSGGFVRIVKIPVKGIFYEEKAQELAPEISMDELENTIDQLYQTGLLTRREAMLMNHFFQLTGKRFTPVERIHLLRSLLSALTAYVEKYDE